MQERAEVVFLVGGASKSSRDSTMRGNCFLGRPVNAVLLRLPRCRVQEDGLAAVAVALQPLEETLAAVRALPVTLSPERT